MKKNMLLSELFEDFRRNERELMEMKTADVTDIDTELAVECAYERQLLYKAANALEFLTTSVPVVYHAGTGETTVETLMEQKQALENLMCLTNNMDNQFVYSLFCDNLPRTASVETINNQKRRAVAVQDKLDLVMDIPFFGQAYAAYSEAAFPVTVAELEKSVKAIEGIMELYDIREDDIVSQTTQIVSEKYQRKELYVFQDTYTREEEKTPVADSLVIVESNDGYVMASNASPELFAENPSLEREFSERVHGNEVVHSETPRETTIDFARVGGNVKYEQYDDIGSVEKGQGVPTYEEKAEMSEKTERATSGNGNSSITTTTTTRTSKTESFERE